MKKKSLLLVIAVILLASAGSIAQQGAGKVVVIDFNDIVHSISAEFILEGIQQANEENAEAVILLMQTPGGLSSSMEQIIQVILSSEVPVVGFVSPSGSKAASAGFYILMACDVAVMSPGTRTGAATPIMMGGGGDTDNENFKTLMEKVKGDSRAFLRSLVSGRKRNPDVPVETTVEQAILAIDKSEAFTEQEALNFGMIDFVSPDIDDLLQKLNGREVRRFTLEGTEPETVVMNTANVSVEKLEMDMRQEFLSYISNPMIALLLGAAGLFGLYIEFNNPGLIFPGVVGAICLILAGISFQVLSVNWAGFLLILVAIALFVLEFKITSFGFLTVGGIICLILGGLILFEGPIPELRLNIWQMLPFSIAFAGITIFLLQLVIKAHSAKATTGNVGLIGARGIINKDGKAFVHGEIWNVTNKADFSPGDEFVVDKVEGLKLQLRKENK